jgi:Rrf2 family iron-sulfur cluster assembly transcriptional regulator
MNVTTRARYALRAVIDIARHEHDGPVRGVDVARREGVSAGYLERLLLPLVEGGVIESRKGPGGGFRLARPAKEISVRDVVLASGESVELAPCVGDDCSACARASDCPACGVWNGLSRVAGGYLANRLISEFVQAGSRAAAMSKNGLRPLRSSAGSR